MQELWAAAGVVPPAGSGNGNSARIQVGTAPPDAPNGGGLVEQRQEGAAHETLEQTIDRTLGEQQAALAKLGDGEANEEIASKLASLRDCFHELWKATAAVA